VLVPKQWKQLWDPRQGKFTRLPAFQNRRGDVRRKEGEPKGLANDLGMKTVHLREVFDGYISSALEATNPGVRANNRLDQAFVARDFRCITVFHRSRGGILRLCRPCDFDFVTGAIPAGGASDRYQQSIAGNDCALKRINGGGRTIGVSC